MEAGHALLLGSRFTVERSFSLQLNGELKAREVARLTYSPGDLEREILEEHLLDDKLVLDAGDGESALELPFACERLRRLDDGGYELSSSDGTEKVVFAWSTEKAGALRPVSWTSHERARFLWKKLVIDAVAEYGEPVWR